MEQFLRVQCEILHPHRHPLADRGELRGLEVRVGEAGKRAIPARELAHCHEHRADPPQQELHRLAHQHEVGVVGDVRARRTQVDERPRRGSLIAEVMDVGHHVVAQPPLVLGGLFEVRVVEMRAQLRQRRVRNREAQLFLSLHERQPQPAPQADAPALAPERLHRGRGVSCPEGRGPAQTAALARATSLLQSARN